ncbi:MAG: hypothetical protein NTW13_00055, partial [Candidatus Omnitrophica bacterium]|nr:hypothetical protein [Candidatus Omnitrophota bacterium]
MPDLYAVIRPSQQTAINELHLDTPLFNQDNLTKLIITILHEALSQAYPKNSDQKNEELAQLLTAVYRKFEEGAKSAGGKISWSKITAELAQEIGFKTPPSIYFYIQKLWAGFIEANQKLVDEGNRTLNIGLRYSFTFPPTLEALIRARAKEISGFMIARSSQRREDSFLRNLAGVFISKKKRDERLAVQAIKQVFMQALEIFWGSTIYEGIKREVSAQEGVAILLQPFLSFKAAGTAMSSRYEHTVIEAVFGDADTAVAGIHANICQYLSRKGSDTFEFNPSYLKTPHNFRLEDKEYNVEINYNELSNAILSYPSIQGKISPLSEAEAKELLRVVNTLEQRIGVPLDIEWGFLNGQLYIIQIRPDVGYFMQKPVEKSPKFTNEFPIAATPIALGATTSEGVTARVVIFGSGISDEAIRQFEAEFAKPYIRVQQDV